MHWHRIFSGAASAMAVIVGTTYAIAQPQPQPQPQPQATAQSPTWATMPRMELERQFAGPLQDTVVQRWRDPVDGTICYLYLPITAQHSPPTQSGFVQYGSNSIGTISCRPNGASPIKPLAHPKSAAPK